MIAIITNRVLRFGKWSFNTQQQDKALVSCVALVGGWKRALVLSIPGKARIFSAKGQAQTKGEFAAVVLNASSRVELPEKLWKLPMSGCTSDSANQNL